MGDGVYHGGGSYLGELPHLQKQSEMAKQKQQTGGLGPVRELPHLPNSQKQENRNSLGCDGSVKCHTCKQSTGFRYKQQKVGFPAVRVVLHTYTFQTFVPAALRCHVLITLRGVDDACSGHCS